MYKRQWPATHGLSKTPAGTRPVISHKLRISQCRRSEGVEVAEPAAPAAKSLESARYPQHRAAACIQTNLLHDRIFLSTVILASLEPASADPFHLGLVDRNLALQILIQTPSLSVGIEMLEQIEKNLNALKHT